MTVADRIRLKREELNISQEELAKRIGNKDKSTISKIEKAGNDITMKNIKRIADALGVSTQYLLGWEEESVQFRDKLALMQHDYYKAKKSGNDAKAREIAEMIDEYNEEHNESFESYINKAITENSNETKEVKAILDKNFERHEKALELYNKIEKADPNIREAILSLLKGVQ